MRARRQGRETSTAPTPGRAAPRDRHRRTDGQGDYESALNAVGLNNRSGWVVAAVLYGVGGATCTTLGVLGLLPASITALGIASIAMSLVCVYGLRRWTNSRRAVHARTLIGLTIIFGGAFLTEGTVAASIMMLPLLTLLGPCYLYGFRFAAPYALVVIALTGLAMSHSEGVQTTAHGVVLIGSMLMIVGSLLVTERRTRALASHNSRLAHTDPLTGIANTRELRETLVSRLSAQERDGREFAVFAIDLDNFKLVNDVFNHGTGDLVLKSVAYELANELEPGDLVARRGGDEFAVIAADSRERDLDELRSRLALAIHRARMEVCPAITPSGGVAYVRARDGDDLANILKRADDQLHVVKRAFHNEHGERDSLKRVSFTEEALMSAGTEVAERAAQPVGRQTPFAALREGVTKRFTDRNPLWLYAAVTFAPIGMIILGVSLVGLMEPLSPLAGAAVGGGFLLLSAASLVSGRYQVGPLLMHVMFVAAICMLTIAVADAREAGGSLVDFYAVLMLFSFYFFSPRVAVFYACICALLFSGFTLGVGYADAAVRVAVTLTVMLAAIAIGVKLRSITVRFARTNRELSEIDALTGLANVRALRSHVATAIGAAEVGGRRPALISLDLDKFKHVNDRYNHSIGDQTLVAVARAISESVRDQDIVARRGGDEFVVMGLFDAPHEVNALVARMSQAIVHARIRICPEITPTASIGWTVWEYGDDADCLLRQSDETLHAEKSNTREQNQVRA